MASINGLDVEEIFDAAVNHGCSDIHIKPGVPPKMRKNGVLMPIPEYEDVILTGEESWNLIFNTMTDADTANFHHLMYDYDYSYELPGVGRFRMNAYLTKGDRACVARLLSDYPKSLEDLGVPPILKELAHLPNGIIFVTGATGSGKSSTMAGMIDEINTTTPVQIISIENPIEILHTDIVASIAQREVGTDVKDFEGALRAALRQDPDVILIGEVRDLETMKTALLAADTGHLVITTLHTTDAPSAIDRILTMYPQGERDNIRQALAGSLRAIIGQRLVPAKDPEVGRVVVNEVLINNNEVKQIILDPTRSAQEIKDIIERKEDGMKSFESTFVDLVNNGDIELKTAKEFSVDSRYYDKVKFDDPNINHDVGLIVPKLREENDLPTLPPLPHITIAREESIPSNFPPLASKPAPYPVPPALPTHKKTPRNPLI